MDIKFKWDSRWNVSLYCVNYFYMFQVSRAMMVSFCLPTYLECSMSTRQSVVYLPRAKRRRQMSLQVDSAWNELNKTPPSEKSWNFQQNTQCNINKGKCSFELFGQFMSSAVTAFWRLTMPTSCHQHGGSACSGINPFTLQSVASTLGTFYVIFFLWPCCRHILFNEVRCLEYSAV